MAAKPDNLYGDFGSVPDKVSVNGSGAQPFGVRATPEDFGAAIGAGISKVGATSDEITQHYQELAVHTATNDAYVNGYAPAVNNLVSNYKKLSGTDAIQQLPVYQKQLKEINNQYLEAGSPMQRELMGGLVARHSISTMNDMTNHADQQYAQHEQIVTAQGIKNASDEAMNSINNPEQVEFQVNRAGGLAMQDGLRKVGPSNNPEDAAVVRQLSNEAKSNVASSVIKAAMDGRNYEAANNYFNKYSDILSGTQKLEITKSLTNLNTINNADNMIDNLVTGKPAVVPGTVQAAQTQTKAALADLAQKEKFDPNILFALHGTESSYGRGITASSRLKDDFQTDPKFRDKGFEGDDIESSVHNASHIWNQNVPVLEKTLGRAATPAEGYVAYNQGGAGASALFNAASTDTAVSALSKIMPANEAMQRVLKNGGTATMSASAFTNQLQSMFQTHYDAQKSSIADGSLPSAIRDHAGKQIPAVQPTTNPHDFLEQFANTMPNLRAYAATIPDDRTRDVFEKKIDAKFAQAKMDDAAWKITQAKVAMQYATDPRYASLAEVPETVKTTLEKAGQLKFLETAMNDHNNPKKDPAYGPGFMPILNRISSDDPTDRIADIAGLQQAYGERQDIHTGGFNRLSALLKTASTPEGKAELDSKAQFLSELQQKIGGKDDAERQANFEKALPLFFNQTATNSWEMSLDPNNKNSFVARNHIKVMNPSEQLTKKINDSVSAIYSFFGDNRGGTVPPSVTHLTKPDALTPAEQIQADYGKGKLTQKEADAKLAALGVTLTPQVPRSE